MSLEPNSSSSNCVKCGAGLHGEYCARCGYHQELRRINRRYIVDEVSKVFNYDRGIRYTLRELFLRPGQAVRNYIREDRTRMIRPIVYVLLCSLIYAIIQAIFDFDDGRMAINLSGGTVFTAVSDWMQRNYGYTNLFMALFIALWTKVFFRKSGMNYYEVLVLLCYLVGTSMLIFTIFGALGSLAGWLSDLGTLTGTLYIAWGIGRFFEKKGLWNFIKGMLSYGFGLFTAALAIGLVAGLFDELMGVFAH